MSTQVEQHGCVVCGRMHTLKVTYGPAGKVQNCVVTSLDGRLFPGGDKPMGVLKPHPPPQI